ncbi:MAG: hypothetical protein RQ751_14300 [Longimicrobiales bacterium]|nr:hypothetical protein [Longimicrobiales bacterium]
MIIRVWRGWTTPENAPAYEHLLRSEIFPAIAAKGVAGYRGVRLLRRDVPADRTANGAPDGRADGRAEVEFSTHMTFDTLEAVRAFAGEDPEQAYVPPSARAVLERFDARARHYDVVHEEEPGA